MKIAILFGNTGSCGTPEGAAALAEAAERCGIESLWTGEHVVFPAGFDSPYPYSPDGKMPARSDAPVPDPLIWMSWVAARTTRVQLGTGVLILPQRNPLVLAKETASLHLFSGGRVILGVGGGWLKEEYEALGVPWHGRGRRLDEYIEAMRALWSQPEASYRGETVSFERAQMNPKPPGGSVPIVIGGDSPAAARRAGRLGDGFFPARIPEIPKVLPIMRRAAEQAGRDADAIEITTLGVPTPKCQRLLEDMGVHRMGLVPPGGSPETIGPDIERLLHSLNGG
jgi:probable F420-dependent oxidoreductase